MGRVIDFQTRAEIYTGHGRTRLDLADPEMLQSVLKECRQLSLSVFSRCSGLPTRDDIAAAINIASSLGTILQCVQIANAATAASNAAIDLERACKRAIEIAESL